MRTILHLAALLPLAAASASDVPALVDKELPSLIAIYRDLHAHPELSLYEEHTSAFLAGELRKAGYEVTEHVGKYPGGGSAFGVVALLKNGSGPLVLVRTDMDALPVEEKTGLPYASKVARDKNPARTSGVMHACGHDMHMTSLIGVARALARLKDRWNGTLMLIGQPAEETIGGARAMLRGRLYERFGSPTTPSRCMTPDIEAGAVGVDYRAAAGQLDSMDVIVRGLGGHGARPDDQGPDRHGRAVRHRAADDRQPPDLAARPRSGHRRLDPRRHQAQHHPRRGQARSSPSAPTAKTCARIILAAIDADRARRRAGRRRARGPAADRQSRQGESSRPPTTIRSSPRGCKPAFAAALGADNVLEPTPPRWPAKTSACSAWSAARSPSSCSASAPPTPPN